MAMTRLSDHKEFVMIDGEGINRADGTQDYVLMCSSTGQKIKNMKPGGLGFFESLDFILNQASKDRYLVSFSFGYDVNMILKTLPKPFIERLAEDDEVWVKYANLRYRIGYIGHKFFSVTEWVRGESRVYKKTRSAMVYDLYTFFNCSFLSALDRWGIVTDKIALMVRNKSLRNEFKASRIRTIEKYCFAECEAGVILANKLRDTYRSVGFSLNRWHGPGAASTVILDANNAKEHVCMDRDVAKRAYFGGRNQVLQVGRFDGVWSYDLRSAYPFALAKLPKITGGLVKVTAEAEKANALRDFPFALIRCKWFSKSIIGPLPIRTPNGTIYYPSNGVGTYHRIELMAAINAGVEIVEILDVWKPAQIDDSTLPFAFLADLYDQRSKLKERGDLGELCLKSAMNAIYGKFAQKKGFGKKPPVYQDYFTAGWITAYVRAYLLMCSSGTEPSIIQFSTDGILSKSEIPWLELSQGTGFGQWTLERHDEAEVYLPGIYQLDSSLFRSRGYGVGNVDFQTIRNCFEEKGIGGVLEIPTSEFVTFRIDPENFGRWRHTTKVLSLMPRNGLPRPNEDGTYRLYPNLGTEFESVPYGEHEKPIEDEGIDPFSA